MNNLDLANCNISRSSNVKNNFFKAHKPHEEFRESLGERHTPSLRFEASESEVVLKVCQLLSEDDDLLVDYGNAQLWCERGKQTDPENAPVMNLKTKLSKINKKQSITLTDPDASLSQRQCVAMSNYESSRQRKVTADPRRPPSQCDQLARLSDDVKNALKKIDLLTRDIASFSECLRQYKTSYAHDSIDNRRAVNNLKSPSQNRHLPVMTRPSTVKKTYSCRNPVRMFDTQNFFVKTPLNSRVSSLWPAKSQIFQLETSLFYADRQNAHVQLLFEPYAFNKTQDAPIGVVKMKSKRSYQLRKLSYVNTQIKDECSKPIKLSRKTALHDLKLNVKPSDTSTDSKTDNAIARLVDCSPSTDSETDAAIPRLANFSPKSNVKGSVDSVELKDSYQKQKIKLRPSVLSEESSLLESKVEDFVDANEQVKYNEKQKIKLKPSKLSSIVDKLALASKTSLSLFESEGVLDTESIIKEKSMTNNIVDELIKSMELFSFNSKFKDNIGNIVEKDLVRKKQEPLNLVKINEINEKTHGISCWQPPCEMNEKLLPETMNTVTLCSSNQESIRSNPLESLVTKDSSSSNPQESKESLTLSNTCSTLVEEVCNNDLKLVNKNNYVSCKQESPIGFSAIDQSFPETDPNGSEVPMRLTQCPTISQTSSKEMKTKNTPVETIRATGNDSKPIFEFSTSNEDLGKTPTQTNESKLLSTQNLNASSIPLYVINCTNTGFDRTQSDANYNLTRIVNQVNDGELSSHFSPTTVWESDVVSSNLMSQENTSTKNSKTVSSSSSLLSSSNVHIDQDCISIRNETDEKYTIDRDDVGHITLPDLTKLQDLTSLIISHKNDGKHDLDNGNHVGQSTNLVQMATNPSPFTNNVLINSTESINEISDQLASLKNNNNCVIGFRKYKDFVHAMEDSVCTSNIETVTSSSESENSSSNKGVENYITYELPAACAKISRECDIENGGKDSLSINLPVISTSFDQDEDMFIHSPCSAEMEHKQCTFQKTNNDNYLKVCMGDNPKTGGDIEATYTPSNFHPVGKSNSYEEANSDTDLEIELINEPIGNNYLTTEPVDGVDELRNSQETYLHSETDQMIQDEVSITETCYLNIPSKGSDELVTQADYSTDKHCSDIKLHSEEFHDFEDNITRKMNSTTKENRTSPNILKDKRFFVSDICCFSPHCPSRKNILDSEGNCPDDKSDENSDVCQTYSEVSNLASTIDLLQRTSAEQKRILSGDQGRFITADSPFQTNTDVIPISEFIYSKSTDCGLVKLSETEPEVTSHDPPQNFEVDSYELPRSIIEGSALKKEVPYLSYLKKSYSARDLLRYTLNNQPTNATICFAPTDQLPENQENYGFNRPQSEVWKKKFRVGRKDIEPFDRSHQAAADDSAALVVTDIGAYDVTYVLEDSSYFPGSKSRPPSPFLVRTRLTGLKSELVLEFGKCLPTACVEAVKRVIVGNWQLDFLRRKEAYRQLYGFVDEKTMYLATGDEASHDIDEIQLLPESFNREIVFWHSLSNADSNCKEPHGRVRVMLACKVLLAFVYKVGSADSQGQRMKSLVKTEHSEFLPRYAVFYTFP